MGFPIPSFSLSLARPREAGNRRGNEERPMAKLSLEGVTKRFSGRSGEVLALEDIWLEVQDGEFLVLVGPSGCGKSSLLNVIAGLDAADSGRVLEDGRPVSGPGRDRSVVFQDGALFPDRYGCHDFFPPPR